MKYEFTRYDYSSYGTLSVLDEQGTIIASAENVFDDDLFRSYTLPRLQAHIPHPGTMIPGSDPRWYTHCQWCGLQIEDTRHDSFYNCEMYYGQFHRQCHALARKEQNVKQ